MTHVNAGEHDKAREIFMHCMKNDAWMEALGDADETEMAHLMAGLNELEENFGKIVRLASKQIGVKL